MLLMSRGYEGELKSLHSMQRPEHDSWSVEKELMQLTLKPTAEEALWELGLLPSPQSGFAVRTTGEWLRSGAETFSCDFAVETDEGKLTRCRIKACVAYSPNRSLASILDSWIQRRTLLAAAGAATPKLIAWGKGVIVEEWIPNVLKDCMTSGTPDHLWHLCRHMAETAGIIARSRFQPVSFFADLMSRGDDVVIVDFGEDLGEPFLVHTDHDRLLEELFAVLQKWNVRLQHDQTMTLRRIYNSAARPGIHA